MQKHTLTFDQLPEYIYELGRKVELLSNLLSVQPNTHHVDEIGGIELAMQLTRLSKARIYTLVSERNIPHKKRGNRLTFNRTELIAWLNEGNRPTADEEGKLLPFGPVKKRSVRHRQPRSVK
ncbi:helix-turn-helix domain-containing protein [Fibrella sp. USSR17]